MRRKLLSVVLCVCMMMTMAPFAFAEGDDTPSIDIGGGSGSSATPTSNPITTAEALKNAINNAEDGNTITISGTIEISEPLVVTKTITLTGGTIKASDTFNPNSNQLSVANLISLKTDDKVLTLKDITLDGNKKTLVVFCNKGKVIIDNATITNGKSGSFVAGVYMTAKSQFEMNSGSITDNEVGDSYKNDSYTQYAADLWIGANADGALTAINGGTIGNVFVNSNEWSASNPGGFTMSGGHVTNLYVEYESGNKKDGTPYAYGASFTYNGGTIDNLYISTTTGNGDSKKVTPAVGMSYTGGQTSDEATAPVARIGNTTYATLAAAVADVHKKSGDDRTQTIELLKDASGSGFAVGYNNIKRNESGSYSTEGNNPVNITINMNGHTYSMVAPTVGSAGTETNGFQFLKNSNVTFKNGTIRVANNLRCAYLFQNYAALTLEDMDVSIKGNLPCESLLHTMNGRVNITGNTNLTSGDTYTWSASDTGDQKVIDVMDWNTSSYGDGTQVTVDTTGVITGKINAGYYTVENVTASTKKSSLEIKNGKFNGTMVREVATTDDGKDYVAPTITITGGYFTTDPSAYCVEGKTGVSTGRADYPYTVGNKNDNSQPATVDSATVPAKTTSDNDTVKEVANNISGAAVENNNATEAATKDIANENTITANTEISTDGQTKTVSEVLTSSVSSDASKPSDENPVAIVYQTYVDVTVTDAKKSDTSDTTALTELSVELTPMYRVVATTKNVAESTTTEIKLAGDGVNAIQIGEPQKLNVPDQEYTIKLALPSNLDTTGGKLSIKHTKNDNSVEYYTGIVSTEGEGDDAKTYVTFTTNGFSPFVIYAASANVASIGDGDSQKVFTTLKAAVDAAQDNDTITLLKDTNENITVSKAVKFTLANKDHLKGTISAGSRYSMTTADVEGNTKYTFTYVGGGSSSSGSTTTTYNVNVNAATNGTVAADKKTAAKGTTVTVTATPSTGYVVDSVKVVDKDGKDVAVTAKNGKYVFTMPGSAVTVTGTFKAETPAPSGLPFTDVKSGDWFYGAVKYAYENGLMTGTAATTFAPNGTMNRAMIVTVLYRLEKSPAVTAASKFTDVPAGQWYSDAVAWAAANNIVNGYSETSFGPMNAVTREQMAAILFRYEQYKGLENVTLEENLNRFPDHDKISSYAVPAMQWAVGQKIINGNADGTLNPTGTATRAQVAQIFTNLLSK